jgi:hypothetical protein
MTQLYATLVSLLAAGTADLTERVRALRGEDAERGAITLETVVIAAGLLAVAIGLIAVIVAAVTGRMGAIV